MIHDRGQFFGHWEHPVTGNNVIVHFYRCMGWHARSSDTHFYGWFGDVFRLEQALRSAGYVLQEGRRKA